MKSIGKKLEMIHGLCGTSDLNKWEESFVISNYDRYKQAGQVTSMLSAKVVDKIDDLYNKHFSGL